MTVKVDETRAEEVAEDDIESELDILDYYGVATIPEFIEGELTHITVVLGSDRGVEWEGPRGPWQWFRDHRIDTKDIGILPDGKLDLDDVMDFVTMDFPNSEVVRLYILEQASHHGGGE